MYSNLFNTLFSLFETQNQLDLLYKKFFGDILADYTYTEMHCVDFIGKNDKPNVTKIALGLNLTKAAISKSIKKLLSKNAIVAFKNPENKKEIYYKLTQTGQNVFDKHLKMHEIWCQKDKTFFEGFSDKDLKIFSKILFQYNETLQKRLEDIKGNLE